MADAATITPHGASLPVPFVPAGHIQASAAELDQAQQRWCELQAMPAEQVLMHLLRRMRSARTAHERAMAAQMRTLGSAEARGELVATFDARVKAAEVLAMRPSQSWRDLTLKKNAIGAAWLKSHSARFDLIQLYMEEDEDQLTERLARRA